MIRKLKNFGHLVTSIIAALYYRFPGKKLIVIGVTGTDGKTTTTNLIYHILTTAGYKSGISSTLDSPHMTTPGRWRLQQFLARCVANKCTHAVVEVSSFAIDQHRVWGIPFEVGVLTNIADHEHLDYHKTFENYEKTKMNFIKNCKIQILPQKPRHFETKLIGDFNMQNISSAVAVAKALNIDSKIIEKAIASFEPPSGRLEIVIKKPFTVIVDFAHTPQAFEKVLPEAKKMGKKLIHVFGCTGDRDKSKRPLMGAIAEKFDDEIILTHEDTYLENPQTIINEISAGIKKPVTVILDRREAIKKALEIAKPGDIVLLTGVGHQKTMNLGGKEIPWSDQKTVLELMKDVYKK